VEAYKNFIGGAEFLLGIVSLGIVGIERFAALVPKTLLAESGKVFYSGRSAFAQPSPLYILGVNPGGAPDNHPTETVGRHTQKVLAELPEDWSAYRDEVWEGAVPGTYGMAPWFAARYSARK